MGLRINTNVNTLTALRTLKVNERSQQTSLERLSTGLRINRGADDPSGLVISEQLRAQIAALKQAGENSQNANNMMSVVDAALGEASNLLIQIQDSIVFAMNTGGVTPEQIAAEQDAVDNAVSALDRMANTTRYGDRQLLNGNAGFQTTTSLPDAVDNLRIRSVTFPGEVRTRDFEITVSTNPERATVTISGFNAAAGATLRVTGPRGTADVILASGTTASGVARALNSASIYTGAFASSDGTSVSLMSDDFGRLERVRMEVVGGTVSGTLIIDGASSAGPMTTGQIAFDEGLDGSVVFEGQNFTGDGRHFSILTRSARFAFDLSPDQVPFTGSAATFGFTVANTGLNFQLNERPQPSDKFPIGIEAINPSFLGIDSAQDMILMAVIGGISPASASDVILRGGTLSTIVTGADNDLTNNPENAQYIARAAIKQLAELRGYIGAVQADTIMPNIGALEVAVENLSGSLSDIRDLDFANESSDFTKSQILFQSNIGVLAAANAMPQAVLKLLGI